MRASRRRAASRNSSIFSAGLVLVAAVLAGCASGEAPTEPGPAAAVHSSGSDGRGLYAFRSDRELAAFLRSRRAVEPLAPPPSPPPAMVEAPSPPGQPPSDSSDSNEVQEVVVTGASVTSNSGSMITSLQEADVDEGGIVKLRGDTLVILRRGRLFTVSLAGGGMRAIDAVDAFPPGVDPDGDWYDEMVVVGDRVVVIGYSYGRGGTEINRFRLSPEGRLSFEDAHHLTSNDYYSSRSYASRVIGDELILYSPLSLGWRNDPLEVLPGLRRWRPGGDNDRFRPIATAREIFIPPSLRREEDTPVEALHTVTRRDLASTPLRCSAKGVLGPESRTFYVSSEAVYLWLSDAWYGRQERWPAALVYRLPLGEALPSALRARGEPLDQFSFREDRADGALDVLVGFGGGGDAMLNPEFSEGAAALLRLPLASFDDGSEEVPSAAYRLLPRPSPAEEIRECRNRFVGAFALYGCGLAGRGSRFEAERGLLFAAPVRGGPIARFDLAQTVDRIEALGRDALVVGGEGRDLLFRTVELAAAEPRLGDMYRHRNAAEAESRSHAFFYRPDPGSTDAVSGILGLPTTRPAPPRYEDLFGEVAEMVFLRRQNRRFAPLGQLAARPGGAVDDDCRASCTDWYGDARPIFLRDRVFALMGYELVEGDARGATIREVNRINFAPARNPTSALRPPP